jgi:hypothetical protein
VFDETKLRRDIETMRVSVQLASGELATAYTPDDRRSLIERVRILQAELSDLLGKAQRLGTVQNYCPFSVGDAVEHAKFGRGVVTEISGRMAGPDPTSPSGLRDSHWRIAVQWEDTARANLQVAHWALKSRVN